MKWHWSLLSAGLVLYLLVLIPGLLPHSIDVVVTILSGVSMASIAIFGFDSIHVDRRLAVLMLILGLIMLGMGFSLARQGHVYLLLLLSVPAIWLAIFGARNLIDKREKHD
jgi:hypothetical protein